MDKFSFASLFPKRGTSKEEEKLNIKAEKKIYVALPVTEWSNDGKDILSWVLNNFSKDTKIILTHVLGQRRLLVDEIDFSEAEFEREEQREQAEKRMSVSLSQCSKNEFEAEKLMHEDRTSVSNGLVDVTNLYGVSNLVMGAAWYSKGMTEVMSDTEKIVIQRAHPSCQIWFICEGNLLFTRYNVFGRNYSTTDNFPPRDPIPPMYLHCSIKGTRISDAASYKTNQVIKLVRSCPPGYSIQDLINLSQGTTRSDDAIKQERDNAVKQENKKLQKERDNAVKQEIMYKQETNRVQSQLDLLQEENKELHKERDNAVTLEFEHKQEIKRIQSQLDSLQEENKNLHKERDSVVKLEFVYKQEIKMVQSQLDLLHEENKKLHTERDDAVKQEILHKQEIETIQSRLDLLQEEHKKLQKERENIIKEVEKLRGSAYRSYVPFSEFLLSELQQATENFSNKHKIGEGGFGCVYKGFLRNTVVAIKMLHPQSLQGRPEFEQEVTILSTVRHPNLVTLIGTCTEKSTLIYEYLPNGSLEDRLVCQGGTPPLTWQMRTRIIGEICRALLFLQSNNPNPIVHGDLKPANILLDANLVSKISDFGISCLLIETNANTLKYCTKNPRGTFAYMDPEFLSRGELTVKSDVYSFGIIILQLLTGKPPSIVVADVEDGVETDSLHLIIDKSAGEWPFVQAKQLANLGLRCAQMRRKKRPDLVSEWKPVESLTNAASLSVSPSFKSFLDDKGVPSYFMCPIFQEVMKHPHVAADGYTYEAAAIKGWLDSGHNTSPMTNLPLLHHELTPNYVLHSAIQEWFLKHP
ncbi:hypothetical protein LUZ63_018744 [Rhynchospora breviuscula]|uniref:RING-type E3 ubiquitin transferase n=1 Tax=Rhynchospora breviuscula TaxID=2022672 RepID=A0A9Q0C4Y6_9POAL|nr:hypothetical protein LUZ63_018744 [Rhynchospora breviuscula]